MVPGHKVIMKQAAQKARDNLWNWFIQVHLVCSQQSTRVRPAASYGKQKLTPLTLCQQIYSQNLHLLKGRVCDAEASVGGAFVLWRHFF